ncbi:hypothetical protein KUCAC02_008597, partial [Chaenocephalus aceratus]
KGCILLLLVNTLQVAGRRVRQWQTQGEEERAPRLGRAVPELKECLPAESAGRLPSASAAAG